jgi:hypothetical protein
VSLRKESKGKNEEEGERRRKKRRKNNWVSFPFLLLFGRKKNIIT